MPPTRNSHQVPAYARATSLSSSGVNAMLMDMTLPPPRCVRSGRLRPLCDLADSYRTPGDRAGWARRGPRRQTRPITPAPNPARVAGVAKSVNHT